MSIFRILLIEGVFAFVFANLLFVNNVFIINRKTIDPFILKTIFIVLVVISFLLTGIFSDISVAFLILALTLGIRFQRGLKRKILNTKHTDPNLNYYWDLYIKCFLKPVGGAYILSAFATLCMYLANYFVLK